MRNITKIGLPIICIILFLCGCRETESYVENKEITISFSFGDKTGIYTGEVKDGIPEGNGTFETVNSENEKWIYTGSWKNGLMNGKGICEWEDGSRHEGEYKDGLCHGEGSWYENDVLVYEGVWKEDNLVSLKRKVIEMSDNEPEQYVHMGDIGFKIPQKWTYEIIDNSTTHITIPEVENVQIIYSAQESLNLNDESNRDAIKQMYIEEYGKEYSDYMLVSEDYNSSGKYDLHFTFYEGDILADVYSNVISRNNGSYVLTVIHVGIVEDYSKAAMCIQNTMKSWDSYLSDFESQENNNSADISKIGVTFKKDYTDGDRLHLKVYVNNNSDKIFTGDIHVFFYSKDGKDKLGSDMIIVEDLAPGRQSWANVIIDKYEGNPKLELEFTNSTFKGVDAAAGPKDDAATEKTKSSYRLNFAGVSWYTDVIDIVVYSDGKCVVTIRNESKENGQFYASTIWSCGKEHGVTSVQVIGEDGTTKSVYP